MSIGATGIAIELQQKLEYGQNHAKEDNFAVYLVYSFNGL